MFCRLLWCDVVTPFLPVIFVETTQFTRLITGVVSDEDYAAFQRLLAESPEKGDLMVGCGGVRKVRMPANGKGTSGGARVLYLYIPNRDIIYLLTLFTKNRAANLSAEGKKTVRTLAEAIKHAHRS